MALIKCTECFNEVSTSAKTCPKCGAKVVKPHSRGQWLFIGLAAVVMVSCIAKNQTRTEEAAKVQAQKSPAQLAAEAKKEADFQRVVAGAKMLRAQTKNPKSFELNSALLMADGTICYQYRATNSFNAVVPGLFVLSNTKSSSQPNDWNKYCGGKSGDDMSYARQAL